MNPRSFLMLLGLGLLLCFCHGMKTTDEVLDSLKGYDSRQRPINSNNPRAPTVVTVSIYIIDIRDVDDSAHTFTAQLYFRQKWVDPRLKYDDTDTRLLHHDDLPRVWKPDLFFVDENDAKVHAGIAPNSFFRWGPDGTMFLSMRMSVTSRCRMDLRFYPHDQHSCTMQIESYGYSANELTIAWEVGYHPLGITKYISDPGFEVKSTSHNVTLESFKFGNYSRLLVDIELSRKAGFFTMKIYLPFIALFLFAWFSLWLNPKQILIRMSLLLVVICVMFILSSGISYFEPRMPYTKAIDIWIAFYVCLIFGLLLEYALLIQLSKESDDDTETAAMDQLSSEEKEETMTSNFIPLKTNLQRRVYAARKRFVASADRITRFAFLGIFALFNVVYWSVYAS